MAKISFKRPPNGGCTFLPQGILLFPNSKGISVEEEWRDIAGYEGYYEVSDLGRVRSKNRIVSSGARWYARLINGYVNQRGYRIVKLCKDGEKKPHQVHRLVAVAFYGPSDLTVDHLNGRKTDNRLINLEFVTVGENVRRYKRAVERGGLPMYVHRAGAGRYRALYTRGASIRKHLGYFSDPVEAEKVVDAYIKEIG